VLIEGDQGIFEVTPPKGINEASFLIRVKDPTRLDFEKVTGKCCKEKYKLICIIKDDRNLTEQNIHILDNSEMVRRYV
jgi:hypothetical protein